ncbi:MAG: cell wall hydrolase [Oscillospiraceae bacterium]|jgi:N-acetylmuramoyl-L-alanine amidase
MKLFSKKRIAVLCVVCLFVCMVSGFTTPAAGVDSGVSAASAIVTTAASLQSAENTAPVYINGIKAADGVNFNGAVYLAIVDFFDAACIRTSIVPDDETDVLTVTSDDLILTAADGQKYVTINGRCFYVPDGLQKIDDKPALPVATLAVSLGYTVAWDAQTNSVSLTAEDAVPLEPAATYYNAEDLSCLSHLINAEAGNQPMEGKIAVGNVVLNRVADPTCPDTIHDVVFDNRYGVQFSVVTTGGIYAEPNEESVAAAKACLEGANVVGNALYFVNPTLASSKWFDQTRTFIATIGEHDFYA